MLKDNTKILDWILDIIPIFLLTVDVEITETVFLTQLLIDFNACLPTATMIGNTEFNSQ